MPSRTEPEGILDFFNKKIFRIPSYQRSYSWEEKQVRELWNDIREGVKFAHGTDHFFGMIIIYNTGESKTIGTKEIKKYDVVDGQQRLTTISLLAASLILELKENGSKKGYENIINELSEYIKSYDDEDKKIHLGNLNQDFYDEFIDFVNNYSKDEQIPEPNNISDRRMINAVKIFKKNIRPMVNDKQKIVELVRYMNNRLKVLEFIAPEKNADLAIKAFQLVNDRGKDITLLDKTKSFLIFYTTKFLNHEDNDSDFNLSEKINTKFTNLFNSYDEIKRIGDEKNIIYVQRQKFSEDDLLAFFYHHFKKYANENYPLEGYDYDIKAEDVYEEVIKEGCNLLREDKKKAIEFVEDLIESLEDVTKSFESILTNSESNDKIEELIRMQNPNIRTYHLLVSAKASGKLDEELIEIIRVLNMRLYRVANSRARASLYKRAAAVFKRGKSKKEIKKTLIEYIKRHGSDEKIKRILTESIYSKGSNRGEKLILWEHGSGEYGITQTNINKNSIFEVLERDHIFPNKEQLQMDVEQYGFQDEEDFEEHKDRIGNLALLEGTKTKKVLGNNRKNLNSEGGTLPPRRKAKKIYPQSIFMPTSILGNELKEKTPNKDWLRVRTERLADFAINHWSIPEVDEGQKNN